jgi:hypothetical protein
MGGGASAAATKYADGGDVRDVDKAAAINPNIYPCQHYEHGTRSNKSWVDREIVMDRDGLYVKVVNNKDGSRDANDSEGNNPRVTPSLLTFSLVKDMTLAVDRTDESRQPVLVLRQDAHVLCIKMRDNSQLDSFTINLNEKIVHNELDANDSKGQGLAKMFELFDDVIEDEKDTVRPGSSEPRVAPAIAASISNTSTPAPKMNIVILVVGTHGDVQPFVYLGKALQRYGHRVRLATHAEYREDVVAKGGLEFYPLAGDPKKLSSYMVKTGGRLMPDFLNEEERRELPEKMKMLRDITFSTWPACTAVDPEDADARPFLADAIISNPVSYGHIHCAEALCIPLVSLYIAWCLVFGILCWIYFLLLCCVVLCYSCIS